MKGWLVRFPFVELSYSELGRIPVGTSPRLP